ncbi:MAG: ABC transporter permease subunit [Candidatus Bathyarchaeia archaeon]
MKGRVAGFIFGFFAIAAAYWLIMTFINNPEAQLLPYYTFRTLLRIIVALGISLLWGITFGILAATNRVASMILTPFIDLLQSIPILGYFPAVVIFFISLFQKSELSIELSAILLLFTSMAWAIFFGVLGAVRGIPTNVVESARCFNIRGFRYIRHVVLPAVVPAIVAGATLAWCDGWFFMIAAEYIQYAGMIYFVPGLGSYLAKASYVYNDLTLAVVLLVLITAIVVYINSLTWHTLMERATSGTYKPVLKIDLSGVGQLGVMRAIGMRRWLHVGDRFHWPRSLIIASQRLRRYTRLEAAIALTLTILVVLVGLYPVAHQIPSLTTIREAFSSPPAEDLPKLPLFIPER